MLPQLTVYAKILCLLMVVMIAGATPEYMYLQSDCSSKYVRIVAKNGTAFADDNGQNGLPQTFTIEAFPLPKKNFSIGVAIRCEETDMYLCFDKNWKIKGMKVKGHIVNRSRCHFYETLNRGYFRFQSVVSQSKYLGFIGSGKPIHYKMKRPIDEKCYNFQRINASSEFNSKKIQNQNQINSNNHAHRHRHGMTNTRSQNLGADRHRPPAAPVSTSFFPQPSAGGGRLSRLITVPPSQRTTQMSNEVHTTPSTPSTQKPTKAASTKKLLKPSKRHSKMNKKAYGAGRSGAGNANIRHHRHHDNRNSKLEFARPAATASTTF